MAKPLIRIGSDNITEPTFLEEVNDLLGEEAVALIQKKWGGNSLFIPLAETLTNDHHLVKLLGWSDAAKFCEFFTVCEYSYRVHFVPMGENSASVSTFKKTNRLVREKLLAGKLSVRQISLQVGMTRRSVFRIKAQLRAEGLLKDGGPNRAGIVGASRAKRQSTPAQKAEAKSEKTGGSAE